MLANILKCEYLSYSLAVIAMAIRVYIPSAKCFSNESYISKHAAMLEHLSTVAGVIIG